MPALKAIQAFILHYDTNTVTQAINKQTNPRGGDCVRTVETNVM